MRQVGSQRLRPARGPQTGVGEERAVCHAGRARLPVDSAVSETGVGFAYSRCLIYRAAGGERSDASKTQGIRCQ